MSALISGGYPRKKSSDDKCCFTTLGLQLDPVLFSNQNWETQSYCLNLLVCCFVAAVQAERLELRELMDLLYTIYVDGARSIFKTKIRKFHILDLSLRLTLIYIHIFKHFLFFSFIYNLKISRSQQNLRYSLTLICLLSNLFLLKLFVCRRHWQRMNLVFWKVLKFHYNRIV